MLQATAAASLMATCSRMRGRTAAVFASMALAILHPSRAHSSLVPGWSTHKFFNPDERTLVPPAALRRLNPPILDPGQEGSFSRHTLLKRLPDTATRVMRDNEGVLPQHSKEELLELAGEVPHVPLRTPPPVHIDGNEEEAAQFNAEWER